ncbi:DUF3742 family protein [Pseudomonas aeruginosa]
MTTTTRISTAERIGRCLGRGWRGYARGEGRVVGWLAAHAVPATMAKALAWVFRLLVVAGLLYVSFWVALLGIALAAVAVRGEAHLHDEDTLKWTVAKYVDPREFADYNPNPYNDITDVNYTDD